MKKSPNVYFLSSEEKDSVSMAPVLSAVQRNYEKTYFVPMGSDGSSSDKKLSDICRDPYPIIVSSSPFGVQKYLDLLRPRWSYYFIGIEHGLSPFKKFTYSDSFLVYDIYFAPNKLWKERLERLYPSARTRFEVGGYAKADDLRQKLGPPPARRNNDALQTVVIFSWGVVEDSFFALPDLPNITYLMHPAQVSFSGAKKFQYARVVRSAAGETERILAAADRVFGDLSSLTFEAALCRPTRLFIDRTFYIPNYDIDEVVMNPDAEDFARVPETNQQIDRRFILNARELDAALRRQEPPPQDLLSTEQSFMAEIVATETGACARGILNVIHHHESAMSEPSDLPHDQAALEFVQYAYRAILHREPDAEGLKIYLNLIRTSGLPASVTGMRILQQLIESKEASARGIFPKNVWPKIKFE